MKRSYDLYQLRRSKKAGLEKLFVLQVLDCRFRLEARITAEDLSGIKEQKRPADFSVDACEIREGFADCE